MLDHSHLCFKRTFHALSAATVLCFRSCSNTIYIYIYIYIFWPIILTYKATILDARPLFFFRKGKKSRPSLIKEHQHHLPTLETEGNFPMALILGKLVGSIQ